MLNLRIEDRNPHLKDELHEIMAVSYTHLDVYKRQDNSKGKRIL